MIPNTEMPEKPKKNKNRARVLSQLTFIFVIIIAIYWMYWYFIAQFYESTDDAYVAGNLVQIMPQTSGHIIGIAADETDLVIAGKPIITLDPTNAALRYQAAIANLGVTIRRVNQLYHQVYEWQSNLALQQNYLLKALNDLERRKKLGIDIAITREDLDHAGIAVESSTNSVFYAKNQLASATTLVNHIDLYHHPLVLQAEEALRQAYIDWQRTTIYAPLTGYVAKRAGQLGQEVNPNSVLMVVVPLNQIWVNANFRESQLKNIRIGQPVTLISDMYGSDITFHGHVKGLGPGTGSTFDLLPPQNATGNWIKIVQRLPVRIEIDQNDLKKFPLPLGLSMTVTVNTHERTGLRLSKTSPQKIIYQGVDYTADLKTINQLIDHLLADTAENIDTLTAQNGTH